MFGGILVAVFLGLYTQQNGMDGQIDGHITNITPPPMATTCRGMKSLKGYAFLLL